MRIVPVLNVLLNKSHKYHPFPQKYLAAYKISVDTDTKKKLENKAENLHIRMISAGSCDTEDWSCWT